VARRGQGRRPRLGPSRATEALVVLARVRAGEDDAAREAIRAHWTGEDDGASSPFSRVPFTHLGRLQVLRPPERRLRRGRRSPADYVLLAADFDAPVVPWVQALRAAAAEELDAVLGHCAFYPGAGEPARFAHWVDANRVPVGFSVIGSPDARLAQIGDALTLRDELAAFAQDSQLLEPAELRAAWRAWRDA
jgi:hypothetical protein